MSFFRQSKKSNFDVLSGYSWDTPGPAGVFGLAGLLLLGALLGNIASLVMIKIFGPEAGSEYGMLISYPLMFIPAMMFSHNRSINMRFMSEPGYAIDSNNFGGIKAVWIILMCMMATLAMSFVMDPINIVMPPMPEWLEAALEQMTSGNFILNFICVSLMAPFFEEWLCRGMVLRGLLNYRKVGTDKRGMHPAAAIVISALFFAIIHMNPWQAVPAFLMGSLFGYVYYKTGSLKLTMLMHFTNNTFALILGQTQLGDNSGFYEIMPTGLYVVTVIAAVLLTILFVNSLRKIKTQSPQGNCDYIIEEGGE